MANVIRFNTHATAEGRTEHFRTVIVLGAFSCKSPAPTLVRLRVSCHPDLSAPEPTLFGGVGRSNEV